MKDNNDKLLTGKNKDIEFEKMSYMQREREGRRGRRGRNVERVNTRPSSLRPGSHVSHTESSIVLSAEPQINGILFVARPSTSPVDGWIGMDG